MPKHDPVMSREAYKSTMSILWEMLDEREKQHDKWGDQNYPSVVLQPHGRDINTADAECRRYLLPTIERAREFCDLCHRTPGQGTWAVIAVEELCEAVGAENEEERRAELIQLGAVVAGWVASIDRRKKAATEATRRCCQCKEPHPALIATEGADENDVYFCPRCHPENQHPEAQADIAPGPVYEAITAGLDTSLCKGSYTEATLAARDFVHRNNLTGFPETDRIREDGMEQYGIEYHGRFVAQVLVGEVAEETPQK